MRYPLTIVLVLAVLSTVFSLPALAQRDIQVKPITKTPKVIKLGPGAIIEDCQVGNLNSAALAVGNFILPPEEYKLVFDPTASCLNCPVGLEVTNIHIVLQTDTFSYQIEYSVNVEEATYPNDPACPEPGIEWSDSGLLFQISGEGLWEIIIPVTAPCLTMDRLYLIGFAINSVTCLDCVNPEDPAVPDLVLDAGPPQFCTNWNNYGSGWYDLVEQYTLWDGNLMFFADANCCSPPVPVEEKTWGAIKEIYSN